MNKTFLAEGLVTPDTFETLDVQEGEVNDKIFRYAQSYYEMTDFNEMNIMDKIKTSPGLQHGFIESHYKERRKLRQLKEKETELRDKWGADSAMKYDPTGPMKIISHKAGRITDSEEYKKLMKEISEQEEVIEYLREVCYKLRDHTTSLKLFLDVLKLAN